jgi:hypothetical protein
MRFRDRKTLILALLAAAFLHAVPAGAFILPYATRTRDFSSWTASTVGDINTIGMGGATLAVPGSISAAESNPAGYAMLTASVTAQINKISFADKRLQRSGDPIEASQWGLGLSPGLWGFGIAYYSPQTESGTYVSPNTGDTTQAEVSMKELRLTAARALFDRKLALGASADLIKAVRELDDESSNAFGLSYRLGALYRLPRHFLLGASFAPETAVGPAGDPDPQLVMPGFNRRVVRPMLIGLGVGWIPNRFFRVATSMTFVGATENTGLLADERVTVGARPTWVPRLGASYVMADYRNVKVEGAIGGYYEMSRLSDRDGRVHVTGGLEVNPYFVNLGAGFDVSAEYKNFIVSVGVDIVRTARSFDVIPPDPVPFYNGTWPNIKRISADGLPDGLIGDEPRTSEPPSVRDVGRIVEDVPENIVKKVAGEKTTVEVKEEKEDASRAKTGRPKKKRKKISPMPE